MSIISSIFNDYKLLELLFAKFKKLLGKSNLIIQFDFRTDLDVWDVGPPFLPAFKKRKVATAHVLNKGETGLTGCEAFLEIITPGQNTYKQFPLHWADTPYEALSSSMQPVTINPLRKHRLDIAFSEENSIGCSIASSQVLATGVRRDQFFLSPTNYQVRVTVVSSSGERARRNFIITSPVEWRKLNMQADIENKDQTSCGFFDGWHSLNMTSPVKVAVIGLLGTIGAAVITGIFLWGNTIIGHSFSKPESPEKNAMSVVDNAGSAQQQNAETIINNATTLILPKTSNGDDEDFERKLAGGLYSYFVSVQDRLGEKKSVDVERIRTYLASNRFFPMDIHVQIGNLLTSIENKNYEAATAQVKDIVHKIEHRYGIKLSETQLGSVPTASADTMAVSVLKTQETTAAPENKSVGIKINGGEGIHLEGNTFKGLGTAIDAHDVEDLSAKNNDIKK